MNDFAKACIYYRAAHDLTQAEMAKKCGVDRTLIIDVERDRHVSKITEAKIRIVLEAEEKEDGKNDT